MSFREISVPRHTVELIDRCDVFALAEELAQLTCEHLPWSDQRVIALEMGVGKCDLAIEDMVRAASHGACPVPGRIIDRLREWLDGCGAIAYTDAVQLRSYDCVATSTRDGLEGPAVTRCRQGAAGFARRAAGLIHRSSRAKVFRGRPNDALR